MTVDLTHERVHADDCADCEEPREGFIDVIRSSIEVTGDLSEEQRERLQVIAGHCPVHKTLANQPHMVEELRIVPE